ncbi:hypothetical protein, conserved [Leishmania lindenbergi]|uniref:Transmembrane protein n=1 Tax=Leishmania lindenbergi TaxID=651832 RepID=A0AAW2ZTS3_9TRYP
MRRAHRHSDGHGVGGVMSDASAVVFAVEEAACTEPQKFISADRNLSSDAGYCHGSANDAAGQATLLERLWRRVDHLISDISYTIEERFIIPQKISAMPGLIEEEVTHRQSFLVLVGHFISIVIVMVIAAYSRRLSHLMSGVSPVVGEILFCASHLSQVTQEQLGWSLFYSGFLSSSTRDWAAVEGGVSGGVVMSNGAAGHGSRRQMLGAIGGGGIGANGALAGGSQGWAGMGSGCAGGMMVCPNTGGSLVRYLLGRKANNMIRHESLRSYLYSSFYSPSAFLVEQTAWFVLLATTMDVVTMQRLAVAVFFANVVGWLPVYSVKLLARLGTALVVVFIFLIPFYEVDDTVTSTLVHHSVYHVLSAYCASLCITLLFAETLLFDDVRRVLVQGVVTLPQRLLRVAGHLSVATKLVRGCMWLRCEYLYFVDFYFFLGIMCWLSLVLMETGAGISVFATAALVITVPSLVGNGWMATPMRALKDTVIYIAFYVVTALLLFHVVPWSGLAFLSNAVQSAAVLLLMAARCEYKQPGGSAYLILWVTMMCVYMYLKSSATRGISRSLVWATNNSNSRANFEKVTHAVWYGVPEVEGAVFDLLRIVFIAFWQFLFEGLSEEGVQLLHFNVVVFGSMLLLSTAVRAVVVEGVRFSSPGQWALTSAEATSTPAAASTPTSATVAAIKGEHNVGAAQVFPGRDSSSSSRGVSNALSCSAPAPSSFAKSKSTQPCGGAKASSLSTASSARRSWQAPSRTAAADSNTYVGGAGRGGAATPGVAGSEETVTDTRVALIKTIDEGKEAAREVESVPRGGGEKSTSPASSAAMDEFPTEDERAPAALEGGTVTSGTPQTSECDAQKSKGGGDPKKQSFRPVTASLAQNRCSAETVDETAAQKRTHPQPICTLDKNSEMVARVFQRDASNIFKETSRSASLEESMNYNATVLTSSMCRSDVSSTTPFSLHHEHSTWFTSRSSTTVEILWEGRRERHEEEPERVRLREQERPKTPSSTTSGALSTPHSMTATECEGEEQRHQTSKSSLKQKKTPETGTMTCASQGTVLPLPRSRVEELKVPGVPMTGPSANSRQSDVTEGKEVVRGKKAVADARAPGASAGKAASLTALTVSADSASAAVVIETGPKDDKGKAARANSEGKKADGKVKAAVGKNAKSKAATESPAGDEKVVAPTVTQWPAPFPLPKPRHEQTAAAEASATAIAKAPAAAGKSTPGETANGEKRGKKATVPAMSNKEGVTNTRKAAAAAPERTQTLAGAAAATASSSQSVMAAPAVLPVPLPRSAQAADAEGTVQSAQTSAESGKLPLEEPVQRPWRDARWANAVSRLSPAVETDGPAWEPASEPKQEVKSKHSAALTADDGEEPDDGYDLDGVLSFLRLKVDYSSVMDDEEDRSNSVSSNADDRHNPTSFRHFESPEDSTVAVQTPLTNAHVVKCGLSGSTDSGVPANVFSTVPQPHDCVNSAHGSLALAQPSRSESLMESSQDTFQAIQSAPEWTAKGRSSFGDLCTNSVASANNNITNASGNYVPNGASSPGFHVFSIHPTATGISTAASSSLSPQPQSVHMGIASHGSAPLFPVAMESCMESAVTAHHIDFNAASTSLGYYQVPQVAVPPSPPMDSRQSSSSHMPFSVSTVNLSASPMSSLSSLGRTNPDTGIDQNGVLSRLHVVPNSRMAMSEQMAMQQSQQTMMVMMRTPDGQMGLYPMVYNQPMPLLDASGMMQQTQRAQVTSQQQQPVYASAPLLRGHSGMVGYQIAPDGSYVMTTAPEVLQQTMNQHQQHQEPHQRF